MYFISVVGLGDARGRTKMIQIQYMYTHAQEQNTELRRNKSNLRVESTMCRRTNVHTCVFIMRD